MTRIRPSTLDDLEAIKAVSVRNGMPGFDTEERRTWWQSHPFRAEFEDVPLGWVLESDSGGIVGTLTNVHMMYELDGVRFRCCIASSWAVDAAHRKFSLLLMRAFFNQKHVDVCLNDSASRQTSQILTAIKISRIPSPDFDLSYLWITRRRAFAAAVLRHKKIPAAGWLSYPVSLALWANDLRTFGRRRHLSNLKQLDGFDDAFGVFSEKLRKEPGRLRAIRSVDVLNWYFGSGLRNRDVTILGAFRERALAGYVVLLTNVRQHLGLRQFVIADLQALDDSPEVILDLLTAAVDATREQKLDALEWQGWNSAKREIALSTHPKSYRYPDWPLFYKAINRDLATELASSGVWDLSPFDVF